MALLMKVCETTEEMTLQITRGHQKYYKGVYR